eukprot:CAMPEP_0185025598 /NCGR_PEP_ID=MMETSP1103-20130426/8493_1 /TAXON_ID=36769 /ORGANISM="Paraphysomonas bandaiensis, Strain Caron Lab Isolate" /LENGTH=798 /DNA_ID=CAMNT_0027558835 /DNA_START=305 /DNA_END=2701 /DNA_ORIENTATION=-
MPRGRFLADRLKTAMSGLTCDKSLINEIFCMHSYKDLCEMRTVYEQLTDSNLPDQLRAWLGGVHEDLILSLLINGRGDGPVDEAAAAATAEKLHAKFVKGASMLGGIKEGQQGKISDILRKQSPAQCQLVKAAWDAAGYMDKSLEAVLKEKMPENLGNACLLLITDPTDAACVKIKNAFGMTCDGDALSRILGGKDKPEVNQISSRYQEKYNTDLVGDIKANTGMHFQQALIAWITESDPTGGLEGTEDEDLIVQAVCNVKRAIASLDSDLLYMAKEGLGTDERMVVQVLCSRTKAQLNAIDEVYRSRYGPTLKEYCEKEMGGNLAQFLAFTQMSEAEFDSYILMDSFSGIGCNKGVVVEVLCTRPFHRIKAAREYFENRTDKNLLDRVRSEMAGPLQRLCVRLLLGPRGGVSEEEFDSEAVASRIYDSGAGKLGTDEDTIVEIFTGHTLEQIQQVMVTYDAMYGCSLAQAVQSEFSGNLEVALSALLCNPTDTYCRRLKDALNGTLGVDKKTVNRIIGGNDKKVVKNIAARYFEKYDVDLLTILSDNLSGDYKHAVVSYVKRPDPTDGVELSMDEIEAVREQDIAEAAAAAEILREEVEMARQQDETDAIEAARAADEERARQEAEERAIEAARAVEERMKEEAEAAEKQARLEAEAEELRQRLEAAKEAEEAAEAARVEMEAKLAAEREQARIEMRRQEEEAAARIAEAEAQAADGSDSSSSSESSSSSSDSSSSDSSSESDDDDDSEEARRRRQQRMQRKAERIARRNLRKAARQGAKGAKKTRKGLKKLGRKMR